MSMKNQTYYSQEKAREVVESVTNFVNTSGRSTAELFAETLMHEHRTLQQGSFYVMSKCIEKWAEQYPLEGNLYVRRSVTDFMDSLTLRANYDVAHMMGSMVQSMEDLNGRLSIMAEYLPKQLRWQGEMLLESGMITRQDLDRFHGNLDITIGTLDSLVAASPTLVNEILDSLYAKLNALLLSVDHQRMATLEVLAHERATIIEFIELQREIIERDAGVLADSAVNEFWNRGQETIDRLVIQLAVAGGILAVVTFLFGLIFGRIFRK